MSCLRGLGLDLASNGDAGLLLVGADLDHDLADRRRDARRGWRGSGELAADAAARDEQRLALVDHLRVRVRRVLIVAGDAGLDLPRFRGHQRKPGWALGVHTKSFLLLPTCSTRFMRSRVPRRWISQTLGSSAGCESGTSERSSGWRSNSTSSE